MSIKRLGFSAWKLYAKGYSSKQWLYRDRNWVGQCYDKLYSLFGRPSVSFPIKKHSGNIFHLEIQAVLYTGVWFFGSLPPHYLLFDFPTSENLGQVKLAWTHFLEPSRPPSRSASKNIKMLGILVTAHLYVYICDQVCQSSLWSL